MLFQIRNLCLLSLLVLILSACGGSGEADGPGNSFTEERIMAGPASPIFVGPKGTTFPLADFVMEPDSIDSLSTLSGYGVVYDKDAGNVVLTMSGDAPPIGELKIWKDGHAWSILLKKSQKKQVVFDFPAESGKYENVQLAGNLNDWNPANTPLSYDGGKWSTTLELNPGNYQYQIVADGTWMLDPNNSDTVDNNIGGFNSLMRVEADGKRGQLKLQTQRIEDGVVYVRVRGDLKGVMAFWENFRLTDIQYRRDSALLRIPIPYDANGQKRSRIRVFAFHEKGMGNEILLPLDHGKVIREKSQLERSDKEAMLMYFMLVDRFANGDSTNDKKVDDPRVKPKANYYGGDLAGIRQKLQEGFFDELNINTLWISPITQNPEGAYQEYPEPRYYYSGYHGYWPISSSKVDHRFGDDAVLQSLVDSAHGRDKNLLLDFVANHVHQEHPLYQQHPDWVTQLDLPDGTKNIRIWDEQRLTTWFDTFLPSLDFSRQEVIEKQADSAMYWLKKFKLDGFRHDATKHIPETFWRYLTKKVKEEVVVGEGRPVYQIGETFGSRELIGSYISSGMMDGQFDFNLYFDARSAFVNDEGSLLDLKRSLESSLSYYGDHHLMGNISGNHDIPRFISFASGALKFGEDEKMAGWNRDIQNEDRVGYQRLKMLMTFIMTVPGIPIIYYGDEIGMPGAGDPDNRRMMVFDKAKLDKSQRNLRIAVSDLTSMRSRRMDMIYGDLEFLSVTEKTMVYARTWFNKAIIVAFNKDNVQQELSFRLPEGFEASKWEGIFGSALTVRGAEASLRLFPRSCEVLRTLNPRAENQ